MPIGTGRNHEEDVELRVTDAGLVIERAGKPREGWAEAAAALRERSAGGLLDEPTGTDFDETEWVW